MDALRIAGIVIISLALLAYAVHALRRRSRRPDEEGLDGPALDALGSLALVADEPDDAPLAGGGFGGGRSGGGGGSGGF